jgi:hypothetical protein
MNTQTKSSKQILQVKMTLEGEDLENWEKLQQEWQGASSTSILRMAVNRAAKQINNRGSQSDGAEMIDRWLTGGVDHGLTSDQEEQAFSNWWSKNKDRLRS